MAIRYQRIPDETIRRLPVYLRWLTTAGQEGKKEISSQQFADFIGANPWQIRKDFSYFGSFGTRGVGYDIEQLIKQLKKVLRLDMSHRAALVGVGNLGTALLTYSGFGIYGFEIAAAFDNDSKKIGKKVRNIIIEDVSCLNTLKSRKVKIGIITVPREASQRVTDGLVESGVTGILNFAPCRLMVPKKVKVITVNIATDLARLPYYMPAIKTD